MGNMDCNVNQVCTMLNVQNMIWEIDASFECCSHDQMKVNFADCV